MATITAEIIFDQLNRLPFSEQSQFFKLIAARAFNKKREYYSHEEVFSDLKNATFTSNEAAEYLEISMSTFRRLIKTGKLTTINHIGRSQLFSLDDLRAYKKVRLAK
jgi:excisionase family DNA binding protein